MARKIVRTFIPVLLCFMFIFPPLVNAESGDLKKDESCKKTFLKDKNRKKIETDGSNVPNDLKKKMLPKNLKILPRIKRSVQSN